MMPLELSPPCLTAGQVVRNALLIQSAVSQQTGSSPLTFWEAVTSIQYGEMPFRPNGNEPELVWDAGAYAFSDALRMVMGVQELPSDWRYSSSEQALHTQRIQEGQKMLLQYFPTTYQAICRIVPYLLVARRTGYGGGGVSNRVGMIWLSPQDSTSSTDHAENLLHEFIHQALFLEDMVDTIFPHSATVMERPENLALSAVRRVQRGYDKSYHSAFVAYGMVQFYLALGDEEKAAHYLANLLPCLDDLTRSKSLLSDNGVRQLDSLISATLAQYEWLNNTANKG
jgi:hypothetical protein